MNLREAKLSSQLVYDGIMLKVKKDSVSLPDGNVAYREWIGHPGAAAIIPLINKDHVVMVKQYRYPMGRETFEIPAGKLDLNESPLECAKRELQEETGYYGEEIMNIGTIMTTPAFTNEIIHLFLVKEPVPGKARTDQDEFLNISLLPLAKVMENIKNGTIIDAKTICAFLLAKNKGLLP